MKLGMFFFIDMGGANTSVSVVEFKKNKEQSGFKILSSAYDPELGGRDIDLALAYYFAERFNKKHKIDLKEIPKCWIRLLMACEGVKKSLNLGSVANINENYIYEDFDLTDNITKKEYIEIILKPLVDRTLNTIKQGIDKSGLTLDQIHSFQWIGGGMRVVELQQEISKYFGKQIDNNLNAEEACAYGCALQCAFLSPRVYFSNKLQVGDTQDYGISINWQTLNDPNDTKVSFLQLVKPGYNLSRNKPMRLTLRRPPKPMQLTIQYENPQELPPGANPIIGTYIIEDVPIINNQQETELRFKFKHDHNGITNLLKAEAVEIKEIIVENEKTEKDSMDVEKKEETKEEKTEETKEEKTEEHEDKVENDEENKMDEDEKTETKEEKTDTKEDKTVKKRKTQTVYHPLKIQRSTAGLPQEKIKEYQTLEEKLIKEDLYVAQVAFTKNALESYIYDSRSKLTEAWSEFAAEDEKIEFGTLLEETLRWFESEGEDQTYKIYKEKLDALQSWGNKFQKRLLEFEERPGAIEFLLSTIENYKKKNRGS